VEYGLAVSLARPGGNLTGITDDAGPEIAAKALELLPEAVLVWPTAHSGRTSGSRTFIAAAQCERQAR
jgi:hypothetical protein